MIDPSDSLKTVVYQLHDFKNRLVMFSNDLYAIERIIVSLHERAERAEADLSWARFEASQSDRTRRQRTSPPKEAKDGHAQAD